VASDIRAGFGFVWLEPTIRAFAIGAGVINLGFTAAAAVLVLHSQDNLALGDLGFGILLASAAVGGVIGAQLAPRTIVWVGRKPSIFASVAVLAVGIAVMGATGNAWVAAAGFASFGFAGEIWNVVSVTYRQSITPDAMLGRVMSGFRIIAYGAFPIGAALGGIIATVVGIRATFYVGGGLIAALLPYLMLATRHHTLDPPSA